MDGGDKLLSASQTLEGPRRGTETQPAYWVAWARDRVSLCFI